MATLQETLDRAEKAMQDQEQLVAEVKKLNSSNRLLRYLVIIVLVGVVLTGVLGIYSYRAATKAQNALDQSKANVAAVALTACRVRNGANQATREAFAANADAFNHAFGALATTPEGQAEVAQIISELRAAIPQADKTDRDCTVPPDGLGADDYPDGG